MGPTTVLFCRAAGVACADVDGEVIVVTPSDARCFSLNATASAAWNLLPPAGSGHLSRDDLVENLLAVFEVDRDICESEVDRLLASLLAQGLVSQVC